MRTTHERLTGMWIFTVHDELRKGNVCGSSSLSGMRSVVPDVYSHSVNHDVAEKAQLETRYAEGLPVRPLPRLWICCILAIQGLVSTS